MPGFTTAMPTSFKVEILKAVHNFTASTGNTFKIALGKATASITGTYGAATTNYSNLTGNSDELPNGSGYTTGGNTLTSVTPVADGTTAICDFADTTWSSCHLHDFWRDHLQLFGIQRGLRGAELWR